ncbi:hypothetical protein HDU97_008543 [Phlyctochytrium planicorne]|nr:hypothetical protein HDU97_008543 [Phlyctochytrium planicorne]
MAEGSSNHDKREAIDSGPSVGEAVVAATPDNGTLLPQPPLYASSRQALCEYAINYFNSYQAGTYAKGKIGRGFMLDKFSYPGDIWTGELLHSYTDLTPGKGRTFISHGGGKATSKSSGVESSVIADSNSSVEVVEEGKVEREDADTSLLAPKFKEDLLWNSTFAENVQETDERTLTAVVSTTPSQKKTETAMQNKTSKGDKQKLGSMKALQDRAATKITKRLLSVVKTIIKRKVIEPLVEDARLLAKNSKLLSTVKEEASIQSLLEEKKDVNGNTEEKNMQGETETETNSKRSQTSIELSKQKNGKKDSNERCGSHTGADAVSSHDSGLIAAVDPLASALGRKHRLPSRESPVPAVTKKRRKKKERPKTVKSISAEVSSTTSVDPPAVLEMQVISNVPFGTSFPKLLPTCSREGKKSFVPDSPAEKFGEAVSQISSKLQKPTQPLQEDQIKIPIAHEIRSLEPPSQPQVTSLDGSHCADTAFNKSPTGLLKQKRRREKVEATPTPQKKIKSYHLKVDHSLNDRGNAALKAAMEANTAVVVIMGRNYPLASHIAQRHAYSVIGNYFVTACWPVREASSGKIRYDFKFQWIDKGQDSWFELEGERADAVEPPPKSTCGKCGLESLCPYQRFVCLNATCEWFFSVDDGQGREPFALDASLYDPEFVKPWKVPEPEGLIDLRNPVEEGLALALSSMPQVCNKCNGIVARNFFNKWECPHCQHGQTISYLNDQDQFPRDFTLPNILKQPKKAILSRRGLIWHNPVHGIREITPSKHLFHGTPFSGHQTVVYEMPLGGGRIIHVRNCNFEGARIKSASSQASDAIFDGLIRKQELPLERKDYKSKHIVTDFLSKQFCGNFGKEYRFAHAMAGRMFEDSPPELQIAAGLLRRSIPDALFNELLFLGYLPGQSMNFHSDGEKGVNGPVVSWSFGASARMEFRVKEKLLRKDPNFMPPTLDETVKLVKPSETKSSQPIPPLRSEKVAGPEQVSIFRMLSKNDLLNSILNNLLSGI